MPDPTGSLPPLANAACCYNYTWGVNTGAHNLNDPSAPGVRTYQDCLANCGNYACCLGSASGGTGSTQPSTGTGGWMDPNNPIPLSGIPGGVAGLATSAISGVENWLFNVFKIGMANFIGIMILIFAVWLLFRETKTKEFAGKAFHKVKRAGVAVATAAGETAA